MKNLTVKYKDSEISLNPKLLDEQDCWENVEVLLETHLEKLKIFEKMEESEDPEKLQAFDREITKLERKLQDLWGFRVNNNYHKFWDRPKCKCPKMDNDDRYPSSSYIIAGNCPLHGNINE